MLLPTQLAQLASARGLASPHASTACWLLLMGPGPHGKREGASTDPCCDVVFGEEVQGSFLALVLLGAVARS